MDGKQLAHLHRQPLLIDHNSATRLGGWYLIDQGRKRGMPIYYEIEKALIKTDQILSQITCDIPNPYVKLCNPQEIIEDPLRIFYGNPAWDLGSVINSLNNSVKTRVFLKQYLDNQGVQVTIIELYTGILYAKLSDAIYTGCPKEWKYLAKGKCADIINGNRLCFDEITSEVLAGLGLPGLMRF